MTLNNEALNQHLHGDGEADLPAFTRLDAVSVKSYQEHPVGHVVYWRDYKALLDHLLPYKEELLKLAEQVGDPSDPFAVWESVDALSRRSADGEAAPFVWAIRDLRDGNPHFDELCVSIDHSDLEEHIEGDDGLEVIPLYRHPAPIEPVAVTDEMVERAYVAWLAGTHAEDWEVDEIKSLLRAALTAALQVKP